MSALLLQALGVVCPTCDQHNPPGAQQCSDCGTPLGLAATPPASKQAPVAAPAATPIGQRPTPAALSTPLTGGTAQKPAPTAQTAAASSPASSPASPQAPSQTPSQAHAPASAPPPARPAAPAPAPAPASQKPASGGDAFPPGMRPAAKGARPQLTPAKPEPIGIRETTPGSVSTVVPSAPTPAAPVAAVPRPETTPRPGPAPIPATELLKPKPAAPSSSPRAASASRYGISVLSGHQPGQRFRLGGAGCMIGRSKGAILFPDDQFISAHHGTLILRDGRLYLRDEASLSGLFVSVSASPEPLIAGACFAAGQRLFRFAGPLPPPAAPVPGRPLTYGAPVPQSQTLYALEELLVGGRAGRAAVSGGPLMTIGQHHCDLSYPGDETLAVRHCELSPNGNTATLRDLSGGLGTWVRVPTGMERALNPGDRFRLGQQVLQVEAVA